jgi:hypothetical protein
VDVDGEAIVPIIFVGTILIGATYSLSGLIDLIGDQKRKREEKKRRDEREKIDKENRVPSAQGEACPVEEAKEHHENKQTASDAGGKAVGYGSSMPGTGFSPISGW